MMQFLVSGYVPGTDIRITFFQLANLLGAITLVYLCWIIYKEERNIREEAQKIIDHINSVSL